MGNGAWPQISKKSVSFHVVVGRFGQFVEPGVEQSSINLDNQLLLRLPATVVNTDFEGMTLSRASTASLHIIVLPSQHGRPPS